MERIHLRNVLYVHGKETATVGRPSWRRRVKRAVAPAYARSFAARSRGLPAAILCYHGVGHTPGSLKPEQLLAHLVYMADDYEVVPLQQLVRDLAEGGIDEGRRRVAITFDDAYKSILEPVAAALEGSHFHATAFMVTGALGGSAPWLKGVTASERTLFDDADVRWWLDAGMGVGSHTETHRDLTRLSVTELERDLAASYRTVRTWTDEPIGLSYPWGLAGPRETEAARRMGYSYAVTTRPGTRHRRDQIFELRRIMIDPDDGLDDLRLKIRGGYDWPGHLPFR